MDNSEVLTAYSLLETKAFYSAVQRDAQEDLLKENLMSALWDLPGSNANAHPHPYDKARV